MQNPAVSTLVLPKIHCAEDLTFVSQAMIKVSERINSSSNVTQHRPEPMRIIPSIGSARGLWWIGDIAGWKSGHENGGVLSALLVS